MGLRNAAESMRRWFESDEYRKRMMSTEELASSVQTRLNQLSNVMADIEATSQHIEELLKQEQQFNSMINEALGSPKPEEKKPHLRLIK